MGRPRLKLGISTCPNDTFAFHGLLSGAIVPKDFDVDIELCDVQTLNSCFRAGEFDAAKASFAAVLDLDDEAVVLPVGAALGKGVGPVVLSHPRGAASPTVLAPGEHTTATLLWRMFHDGEGALEQVVFSAIMPALQRGEARLGVCIHEGRFTYQEYGLELAEDLGLTWERATRLPLPLGGIIGRRRLGEHTLAALTATIRESLAYARAHPAEALETMRLHAQEQSDSAIWKHVELYVTDETVSLSREGRLALAELARRAHDTSGAGPQRSALEVFGPNP